MILAKNLPARTAVEELRDLFARHGDLARVVLPPNGGVTALVEFLEVGQTKNCRVSILLLGRSDARLRVTFQSEIT